MIHVLWIPFAFGLMALAGGLSMVLQRKDQRGLWYALAGALGIVYSFNQRYYAVAAVVAFTVLWMGVGRVIDVLREIRKQQRFP